MKNLKVLLFIFVICFYIPVDACISSISVPASVNNRTNGHQNQCRGFGSFSGSTDGKSCFSVSSSNGSVVTASATSSGFCFYSKGHGTATVTISVNSGCLCPGVLGLSGSTTFSLSEWGLRSLKVEGYEISPKFSDYDKVYTLNVGHSVDKINIIATPNDSKSKVSGDGEKTLVKGENVFKISVTSIVGRTDSYTLKVYREEGIDVTGISLNETDFSLNISESKKLNPTISPSDATTKDYSWEISDESILSINNDVVTALKNGVATVTVKSKDGNFTDSIKITVKTKVTDIKLEQNLVELKEGEEIKLDYQIFPEDASNKNVKLISDDTNVAIILTDGTIKAFNPGETNISVITEDGNIKVTCKVIVSKIQEDTSNFSVITTNIEMPVGNKKRILISNPLNEVYKLEVLDNSIVDIEFDTIEALKKGETIILVKDENDKIIKIIPVTITSDNKLNSNYGINSFSMIIIVLIVIIIVLSLKLFFNYKSEILNKRR